MLTLFGISTLEGWPTVMYQATQSTDVDRGPKFNASPLYAYYFIAFILIGTYFFLNFFIGVLFLKYN
jgi:voltage-dependent calcium channel L type alpha-1D